MVLSVMPLAAFSSLEGETQYALSSFTAAIISPASAAVLVSADLEYSVRIGASSRRFFHIMSIFEPLSA